MRRNVTGAVLGAVVLTAALAGCDSKTELQTEPQSQEASSAAVDFASQLRERVSVDAMMGHLSTLQDIANANDGTRALGTPGYDASVDYVVKTLRDKGFDVDTPEFEVRLPFAEDPQVTVGGQAVTAKPLEFTIGTAPEGVSARSWRPRSKTPRAVRLPTTTVCRWRALWCSSTAAAVSSRPNRPPPPNAVPSG